MALGLREQRKHETRQRISDTATLLFIEHGFEQVTISQVAEAAGVAKMTVTNYFPRKEDMLFDRAESIELQLADVITHRGAAEGWLAAIRRDYLDMVARADVTLGLSSPQFAIMVNTSPVLTSRALEMLARREQALGDALAAETGTDTPLQRLIAAQLAAVHHVLYAEASRRSVAGESREAICAVLAVEAERAFALLEPSLGGYGVGERDSDRGAECNGLS
ncbi:MAG TPA: TetR/AcrR family transcriptional regulator [Trebonia sp.]|nr:TetR/AcrR family transcriptional regulator [Trebonia sp.]